MKDRVRGIVAAHILADPGLFDADIMPRRRFFLLYGRAGIGKYRALKAELAQCKEISVAEGALEPYADDTNLQILHALSKDTESDVILINDAHHMIAACRGAVTARSVHWLRLRVLFSAHNAPVIFLSGAAVGQTTEFEGQFYAQFDERMLLHAPNFAERARFYAERFDAYARHVAKLTDVDVAMAMSEADCKWLSECSAGCTYDDMVGFCRRVFYDITAAGMPPQTLDRALLERAYMQCPVGIESIVAYDAIRAEDAFRSTANLGPLDTASSRPLKRTRLE